MVCKTLFDKVFNEKPIIYQMSFFMVVITLCKIRSWYLIHIVGSFMTYLFSKSNFISWIPHKSWLIVFHHISYRNTFYNYMFYSRHKHNLNIEFRSHIMPLSLMYHGFIGMFFHVFIIGLMNFFNHKFYMINFIIIHEVLSFFRWLVVWRSSQLPSGNLSLLFLCINCFCSFLEFICLHFELCEFKCSRFVKFTFTLPCVHCFKK